MLTLALLISLVPAQSAFAAPKITTKMIANSSVTKNSAAKLEKVTSPKKGRIKAVMPPTNIGNYQIQVCKNNKFKKLVKNCIPDGKKCIYTYDEKTGNYCLTLKGLKKGTYYVRVRWYESGLDGVYGRSKWSKAKKIKVK